jgi:hypothetical protein
MGMSTRAVAIKCHVNFSTISLLQCCFGGFDQRFRPATWTADETVGLHNQRISTQTVRNHLRAAHVRACHPHQGLDLTAVPRRKRLQWAKAHL